MKFEHTSGGFTLPGESGQEKLTLELAKKWGADVIRDSDGTQLSDEILDAGYDIYSTICIIRDHNAWAKEHPECLQQSFLNTEPVIAAEEPLTVKPMAGFFDEQFKINDRPEALRYWQVWDRTANKLLPADTWQWDAAAGTVTVASPVPFHAYTVSFLAWRTWEEINMYNHVTNSWTSEHLLPVDPRTKEAQDFLYDWLKNWGETHPQTNVVRFTSMCYDFTVSEKALDDFAAQYGYTLTAEDFINKGSLQVTHMPPTAHKRDYMEFTQQFVAGYGKKLVDLVHSYGKRAYVFYDDSWVGVEPYGPHFKEFGFDGVIKCVFSGYEVRMCAGVDAPVHELRFHPYLFPVGLGGAPTFAPGGNPTRDAAEYWNHVRRALLRAKIDRIGLGGYLHLLNDFPDFVEYIADISDEFRAIKELHTHGAVATLPLTVAVLHSWGSLRPWTLSGHFHETYMHTLIHINEALAGLPVNVKFINFDDVKNGVPDDVDVIINAGRAGSAWSGGDAWQDETLVAALNKWVYNGGVLLGVEEPSAVSGYGDTFRMARILGVDEDTGARVCHGRWPVQAEPVDGLIPDGATLKTHDHLYMTDGGTRVLAEVDGTPAIAAHAFGKGRGVYMAGFEYSPVNARMLLNLLLWAKGLPLNSDWLTTDPETEAAWFPADKTLVVINNSTQKKSTVVKTPDGDIAVELDGLETKILPQN